MKKLLAILVALTLLCLPVAMAEETGANAAILNLSNINAMGMDLGELEVWAGIDAQDAPTFQFRVQAGEEVLTSAVGQLADNQVKLMFDGDDKAYAQDLSQLGESAAQLPELLKQLIPALDKLVLPPVPALSIPKLDTTALLSAFSADGQSFSIPTEMVDSLLDMAQQYGGMITGQVPQAQQLLDLLPQLKGMFSFSGTIADEGDAQVTRVNLEVSGEAQGALVFTTRENNIRLALETDGAEQAGLSIVSDPGSTRVDVTVDALGMDVGAINLYRDGDLQKIAFNVTAAETVGMELGYGAVNGEDVVQLTMSAGSSGSFLFNVNTVKGEDGQRVGTLSFTGNFDYQHVELSADVAMCLGDLDVGEITWPDTVLPFSQLDPQGALAPVVEYLQGLQAAA